MLKSRLQEKVNWPGVGRNGLMEPGLSVEPACGARGLCQSAGGVLALQGVGRIGGAGVPLPPSKLHTCRLAGERGLW